MPDQEEQERNNANSKSDGLKIGLSNVGRVTLH